ncbi:hypothetical protein CPAR01_10281 [Colletotrichum paranaense]|uniref:Glutamyl-tRNA(Gln) amidotransferase subunit A, mitochondrial n=1 Tax=Colletotrichum paranaense TaxID=1914294 RepID=A0ABQ9SDK9_9PEZI|nr:uncharacterized protein CPAR01_10281 [Colletotrichum paranaense]KAK1533573.1 hypothetical protein CPAR01_10281 [Colletotrichum paranaense]
MPSIADIPCELVSSILRSLDDFETLTSALLACRHIYTSFKQIAGTELAILRRKIGLDLLPYAVASLEASRLKPSPGDDSSIRALLDLLYDNPSQLVARTASISSELLRSMSRKHDWVTTLALSYAAEAKIHLASDIAASPEAVDLSPPEYIRFCRAFYRVDLFYLLFGAVGNFNGLSGMGNLLFHRHPPWVNEQLGCVHDFIEDKFLEASIDVLAHDVTFGEYEIDYLTTGGDNMMIQSWAVNAGTTNLPDAFGCIMDDHAYNNTDLEDFSASELATIIPACDNVCNTDKGLTRTREQLAEETCIRLWDWVYIRGPDVLKLFAIARCEDDGPSAEALEEMEKSFKQRSLIWQTSTMTQASSGMLNSMSQVLMVYQSPVYRAASDHIWVETTAWELGDEIDMSELAMVQRGLHIGRGSGPSNWNKLSHAPVLGELTPTFTETRSSPKKAHELHETTSPAGHCSHMSSHIKLSRLNLRPLSSRCSAQATRQQRRSHHDFNHFVCRSDASEATLQSPNKFKLAVKDNIATEGLPTTCSSAILSSHKSPYEATIVRQLRKRGAQVVGKTNMDEFGMGSHSLNSIHGPVLNSLSATPTSAGGSSGGSAVAVQTSEADVALGTDTGGSIRLPAAYCGVVGYKPSYGMLSRFGVVPYANSLDTVGLLARDVDVIEDLMFSTGLDAEHDSQDPTSLSKSFRKKQQSQAATGRSRLRIGIPLEYNIEELDPKIKAAWSDAADLLQKSGIEVVPVSLPSTKHALSAYYVIAPAEASSNLAKYDGVRYGTRGDESDGAGEVLYSKTRGLGLGEEVRRRILLGAYSLSSEAMDNYFIQAQRVRKLVQRDFDRVFRLENPLYDEQQFDLSDMKDEVELQDKLGPSQVDFLLCPTAPTFAPRIEDIKRQTPVQVYMNDVFTVPASLAGLPAISIPTKIKSEDEEVDGSQRVAGLQLIGQYWDDKRLLSVAKNLLSQLLA